MTTAMYQLWQLPLDRQAYVWRAPEPRANLLLQHGYSEYAERFVRLYNELIPQLLAHHINVYAFDMQGHGRSPGERGLVNVDNAVQDHLAARQALANETLPLFLFGHSLGGLVTASSVALNQNGVAGVILTSPAIPQHNILLRLLARVLAALAPGSAAPLHPDDPSLLSRRPEVIEDANNDAMKYQGKLRNLVAATALSRNRANRKLYPGWKVPVLILHGTDDRVTDPRGSQILYDTIAAEDKTLHLIEGGYHELLNDTERDDTLRLILDWLDQRVQHR
ncbi:MAG: alpha/beta fold hydrolase [Pseudomonadales bacterium]|nr:alpha/beta fold hydrolase [Pseudomonadales bacterium]